MLIMKNMLKCCMHVIIIAIIIGKDSLYTILLMLCSILCRICML